jgi:hypothetical protein
MEESPPSPPSAPPSAPPLSRRRRTHRARNAEQRTAKPTSRVGLTLLAVVPRRLDALLEITLLVLGATVVASVGVGSAGVGVGSGGAAVFVGIGGSVGLGNSPSSTSSSIGAGASWRRVSRSTCSEMAASSSAAAAESDRTGVFGAPTACAVEHNNTRTTANKQPRRDAGTLWPHLADVRISMGRAGCVGLSMGCTGRRARQDHPASPVVSATAFPNLCQFDRAYLARTF